MNYDQMNNNRVEIRGKVLTEPVYSHEVFGEGFYECQVAVPRLSQNEDIIPITVSERLLTEHALNIGDEVSVNGQFRSYNKIERDRSKLMLTVFVRDFCEDVVCSPNLIEITGFICKPPIYRTTPFKREICDILLAVNRAYNKSDYIPCITWGRNARFVKNIPVGTKLTITGRIQSRCYQKVYEDGTSEDKIAYEVSVNKILVDNDDTSRVNENG